MTAPATTSTGAEQRAGGEATEVSMLPMRRFRLRGAELRRLQGRLNHPPGEPPPRARLRLSDETERLDVVMHEYDAIRGEVETTLSSQVAILNFGAATIGLLVAAAAALWKDQSLPAGLVLLFAVPLTGFLTLAVYGGELVRLMRAGLFLNHLECSVNDALMNTGGAPTAPCVASGGRPAAREMVLTWEQWSTIRKGGADVDMLNRLAVSLVFVALAVAFAIAGYLRLHTAPDIGESWAAAGLVLSVLLGLLSINWLLRLGRLAYSYRDLYRYAEDDSAPMDDHASGHEPARTDLTEAV